MTYQSLRPMPLTLLADQWGAPPAHFWLRGTRPEQPVALDERTGIWNVYGYPEIVEVFSDPVTYSSDTFRRLAPDVPDYDKSGLLTQMDPPVHRKLRQLVSRAFTPRLVAGLAPRIGALTHELLDRADDRGALELVDDLAHPLPVIVIAELLGVPASDRPLFRQWSEESFPREQRPTAGEGGGVFGADEVAAALDLGRRMNEYFAEHADDRRRHPREDLLTLLVQAEVDGERLSSVAVGNLAQLLLIAGHVTTTMLLGNTVLCLDAHPEYGEAVRRDPTGLPAVIEESLRLLTPFQLFYRATTRESELGGQRVPAGQALALVAPAAGRIAAACLLVAAVRLRSHGLQTIKEVLQGGTDTDCAIREQIVQLGNFCAVADQSRTSCLRAHQLLVQKVVVGTLNGDHLHAAAVIAIAASNRTSCLNQDRLAVIASGIDIINIVARHLHALLSGKQAGNTKVGEIHIKSFLSCPARSVQGEK